MSLKDKSIVELRGIAQGLGIPDLFNKSRVELVQQIELKSSDISPIQSPLVPEVRFVSIPSDTIANEELLKEALDPFIKLGVSLSVDNDVWFLKYGKKEDAGTMHQPIKNIIRCVERLLK